MSEGVRVKKLGLKQVVILVKNEGLITETLPAEQFLNVLYSAFSEVRTLSFEDLQGLLLDVNLKQQAQNISHIKSELARRS